MYGEWIAHWAKRSPGNVAVVLPQAAINYAAFDGHINKVAARLAALAIPPGSRVAVHVADVYLHWLLVLALDRLGVVSASLDTLTPGDPVLVALKPDLVLSDADWDRLLSREANRSLLAEGRVLILYGPFPDYSHHPNPDSAIDEEKPPIEVVPEPPAPTSEPAAH